eukprot:12854582-Alexandrium_andersonii.AAC.1
MSAPARHSWALAAVAQRARAGARESGALSRPVFVPLAAPPPEPHGASRPAIISSVSEASTGGLLAALSPASHGATHAQTSRAPPSPLGRRRSWGRARAWQLLS